ncbi:unnamed protein product, partial [Didymodactylos carnosus]
QNDDYPIDEEKFAVLTTTSDESLTSLSTQLKDNFAGPLISEREYFVDQTTSTIKNSTISSLDGTIDTITSIKAVEDHSSVLLYSANTVDLFDHSTPQEQGKQTRRDLTDVSVTDQQGSINVTRIDNVDYTSALNEATLTNDELVTDNQNLTSPFSSFYDYNTTDVQEQYSNISATFDNITVTNINDTFRTTPEYTEYSEHTKLNDQDFSSFFITDDESSPSTADDKSRSIVIFSGKADISDLTTFTDSEYRTTLPDVGVDELTTKFEETLILDDICRANPDSCSWVNSYDTDETDSLLPQTKWKKTVSFSSAAPIKRPAVKLKYTKSINIKTNGCLKFSIWTKGNLRNSQFWIEELSTRNGYEEVLIRKIRFSLIFKNETDWTHIQHTITKNIFPQKTLMLKFRIKFTDPFVDSLAISNFKLDLTKECSNESGLLTTQNYRHNVTTTTKSTPFPRYATISDARRGTTTKSSPLPRYTTTNDSRRRITTKSSPFPRYTTTSDARRRTTVNRSTIVQHPLTVSLFDETEGSVTASSFDATEGFVTVSSFDETEGSGLTSNMFPTEYVKITTNDETSAVIMNNDTIYTTDDFSSFANTIDGSSSEIDSTVSFLTTFETIIDTSSSASSIQEDSFSTVSSEIKTSKPAISSNKSHHRSSLLLVFPLEMRVGNRLIIIISTLCLSLICCTTLFAVCALRRRRSGVWNVRFDSPIQLIRKISLHSLPLKQISRQASSIVQQPKSTILTAVSTIYGKDVSARYEVNSTPSLSTSSLLSQTSKLSDSSASSYYTYL